MSQLVVKLKAIEWYKRLLCYLSFLPHISGLFFIFGKADLLPLKADVSNRLRGLFYSLILYSWAVS